MKTVRVADPSIHSSFAAQGAELIDVLALVDDPAWGASHTGPQGGGAPLHGVPVGSVGLADSPAALAGPAEIETPAQDESAREGEREAAQPHGAKAAATVTATTALPVASEAAPGIESLASSNDAAFRGQPWGEARAAADIDASRGGLFTSLLATQSGQADGEAALGHSEASAEGGPVMGCSCLWCTGSRPPGDGEGEAGAPPGAPGAPGTLQTLANYLRVGFWDEFAGLSPQYFNVDDNGAGANFGQLRYNVTGTPSTGVDTFFGIYTDTNGISAARATLVREAFNFYEAVLGVDFVETTGTDGGVDFFFVDSFSGAFEAPQYFDGAFGGPIDVAVINVASSWQGGSSSLNGYTFQTFLHEIGHALGLGHQGLYNAGSGSPTYANSAQWENDSWALTMMSYWNQVANTSASTTNFSYATLVSPMTVDWIALNALYGGQDYVGRSFGIDQAFTGDTIWGNGTNITAGTSAALNGLAGFAGTNAFTIVDGGGIDTIDFSNYAVNQTINLNASSAGATNAIFSSVGGLTGNMSIAVDTVIENAVSGSGNDNLIGNSADNTLTAGAGNDTVDGGAGNDLIHLGDGNDYVTVTSGGNDTFYGGNGDDSIYGHTGDEYYYGQAGNDTLLGSSGDDFIEGGAGADLLNGHSGTDTLSYAGSPSGVTVNLATSTASGGDATGDTIVAGSFENVRGSAWFDSITGDGGNNVIEGGPNADTLNGGAGNDTLYANTADDVGGSVVGDVMNGEAGDDVIEGSGGSDTIDAGEGKDTVHGGEGNDTISSGIGNDTVDGDSGDDSLLGGAGNDSITGGSGNDLLDGGDGNDTLVGGLDVDTVNGGAGDDLIVFGNFNFYDNVDGGAGTDTLDATVNTRSGDTFDFQVGTISGYFGVQTLADVEIFRDGSGGNIIVSDGSGEFYGNDGDDTMTAGLGASETIDGGAGTDTLDTSPFGGAYVIDMVTGLTNFAGEWFSNFENLISGAGNDSISATAGANVISTNAGDDIVNGGGGNDTVDAGIGNDTVYGEGGDDSLVGGDGNDRLDGGNGTDTLRGGAGDDMLIQSFGGPDAIMDGGTGVDTGDWSFSNIGDQWAIDLVAGTAKIGATVFAQLTSIENVVGGQFGDTITGNSGANVLDGQGGDDTIKGGSGADTLDGGSGTDTLSYSDSGSAVTVNLATSAASGGTAAGDAIVAGSFENVTGSSYSDSLAGDGGNNVLEGGGNRDTINGGAGDDTLYAMTADNIGGSGSGDLLNGEAGNDLIWGSGGGDTIDGGTGADTINGGAGGDVIDGGDGDDTLDGGAGTDTLTYASAAAGVTVTLSLAGVQNTVGAGTDTLSNFENLTGSNFDDSLSGNNGANVLRGLGGDDTIRGGSGADTLDGGIGTDTLSYADSGSAVTVNLATSTVGGGTAAGDVIVASSFENVRVSSYSDSLTGDGGNNVLEGGGNRDTINGGAGDDTLYAMTADNIGGSGSGDLLNGEAGNDLVWGSGGGDTIDGGTGADTINGGAGSDVIDGGDGDDSLDGGADADTVSYASATAGVTVNLSLAGAQNTVGAGTDTLSSFENLTGSNHDDTLSGNNGANVLRGLGGDDTIRGGSGADTLDGGSGTDTLSYADSGSAVTVNLATGTVSGGTAAGDFIVAGSFEYVTGSSYSDSITGDGGNNVLEGGGNRDTINGGAGDDTLYAMTAGNIGGSGSGDLLNGEAGNDQIWGSGGGDTIDGGAGSDTVSGGGGADTFVLNSLIGSDTIADFTSGLDKLSISRTAIPIGDGDGLVEGAVSLFGPGGFDVTAELVIVTDDILGAIDATSAAAAIGAANAAYGLGQTALFTVDNGADSALFLFNALDADALVEFNELTLLATLTGTSLTAPGDYVWGA